MFVILFCGRPENLTMGIITGTVLGDLVDPDGTWNVAQWE